jgi:hypothetical protein
MDRDVALRDRLLTECLLAAKNKCLAKNNKTINPKRRTISNEGQSQIKSCRLVRERYSGASARGDHRDLSANQ